MQSSSQPSFNDYQYLGKRTFAYWLLQRSVGAIIIFVLFLVLIVLANSVLPAAVFNMTVSWNIVALGLLVVSLAMLFGAFISTRFMYNNNRFYLDENALRVRRGIINQQELALPYRQIQNVNIERSALYQTFGLSQLTILTAGQGFGKEGEGGESNEVFSTIDADVASWLQGELLQRINVQKVTEAYPQAPATPLEQANEQNQDVQSPQGASQDGDQGGEGNGY